MLSEYTRVLNARRGSPEKKSVSARYAWSVCAGAVVLRWGVVYILEEAQQVGNSFPFAVGQHRIIDAVSRASYTAVCQSGYVSRDAAASHTAAARSKDLAAHI
jgi:hypothetical protein